MIKNQLEEYLFNSVDKINDILDNNLLIEDKNITNKNDYYFIHEKEKEIDNKFLIQIPQFKPKDIVLLYFQIGAKNKKADEYEIYEGPIIKLIKYNRILDVLKEQKNNILNDNFGQKNAKTTAIQIIYTLSKNTFTINESFDVFEQNIDDILSNLAKNNTQEKKEFINIFKITLDIAKKIDEINKSEKIELNLEDTKFIDEYDWYQNIDYTTQYPHLIYILNKYDGIFDDIKELYKKDSFNKNNLKNQISIPYWLILLRLLTYKDNIEIDYY